WRSTAWKDWPHRCTWPPPARSRCWCTSCSSAGRGARARSPAMRASAPGSRRWTNSVSLPATPCTRWPSPWWRWPTIRPWRGCWCPSPRAWPHRAWCWGCTTPATSSPPRESAACWLPLPFGPEWPDSVLEHRLARHLLIAHRRVVDHAGDDRRGLLEVLRRGVVVGVQVGVVDVGAVVQAIVHELEARQADPVERDVVGAAGVARDHHGGADVGERRHPCLEDRHRGQVLLGVHAADLARAVVQVEVGREPVVRGLALQLATVLAQERRQRLLRRVGRFRIRGEGARHVV